MGFRNLWKFRKAVWHFHACDWSGLLELMEVALTEMRDGHRNYSLSIGSNKMDRELTIAKELCKRLHEENYWSSVHNGKHENALMERDVNYLADLLRNVRCWWY